MKAHVVFSCLLGLLALTGQAQPRQPIRLNEQRSVKPIAVTEATPESLPIVFGHPGKGWYAGTMPKQVQEFILEQGELPDPHVSDNAALWVPVFEHATGKDAMYFSTRVFPPTTNPRSCRSMASGMTTTKDRLGNWFTMPANPPAMKTALTVGY